MKCPWCANPEGIAIQPPLMVKKQLLVDDVCPYGAIKNKVIDRLICENCPDYSCTKKNKNEGIFLKCQEYDTVDLLAEVLQAKPLFFDEGGITLTGGEPTLQYQSVLSLLKGLKSNRIHTAMETNGTSEKLVFLSKYIDQIIIDFKHPDSQYHRSVLGLGNQRIKENIQQISKKGKKVYIRIPLINGFNTSQETFLGFVDFFKTLEPDQFCIEILPFHEFGKTKWQECGMVYNMDDSAYVDNKTVQELTELFQINGFEVIST